MNMSKESKSKTTEALIATSLEMAREQFGYDKIINMIDPYVPEVVGEATKHNGSALYVDWYSGRCIARFEYGRIITFWNGDTGLAEYLRIAHLRLWNERTKPPEPEVVIIDTPKGQVVLQRIHPNNDIVEYWATTVPKVLLLSIDAGGVIETQGNFPAHIMWAALSDYLNKE